MDVLPNGTEVVAHWEFVADTEHSWVTGQVLVRSDGVLLRRYGGSSSRDRRTTWEYHPWTPVPWWSGETDGTAALRALQAAGYDLTTPGPVPVYESTAGPFDGYPPRPSYL
ncbi:hypothetical protein [Actinosynnema sp. NPDC020468]|uniref:hypothetical protein n=1 Tax=Actinosynnema sp. NPDC020468 TaxID=3154488 RepID=UPI003406B4E5